MCTLSGVSYLVSIPEVPNQSGIVVDAEGPVQFGSVGEELDLGRANGCSHAVIDPLSVFGSKPALIGGCGKPRVGARFYRNAEMRFSGAHKRAKDLFAPLDVLVSNPVLRASLDRFYVQVREAGSLRKAGIPLESGKLLSMEGQDIFYPRGNPPIIEGAVLLYALSKAGRLVFVPSTDDGQLRLGIIGRAFKGEFPRTASRVVHRSDILKTGFYSERGRPAWMTQTMAALVRARREGRFNFLVGVDDWDVCNNKEDKTRLDVVLADGNVLTLGPDTVVDEAIVSRGRVSSGSNPLENLRVAFRAAMGLARLHEIPAWERIEVDEGPHGILKVSFWGGIKYPDAQEPWCIHKCTLNVAGTVFGVMRQHRGLSLSGNRRRGGLFVAQHIADIVGLPFDLERDRRWVTLT